MTVKVYQGKRADWVGRLPIIGFDEKQAYVQYLGLTDKDHGHYPMVALYKMPSQDFYKWFKVTADPVGIYAKIYSEHARIKGITGEASALLEKLTPNDDWNTDMGKPRKEEAPKAETKKPAPKAAKPAPVEAKAPKAAAAPTEPKEKKERHSVSGVIRALILANATAKKPLNDDEIFAKAQESFPELDEGKRGYVPWVRSKLIRDGVADVPEPVGGAPKRGRKPNEPEAAPAPAAKAEKPAKAPKAETKAAPAAKPKAAAPKVKKAA